MEFQNKNKTEVTVVKLVSCHHTAFVGRREKRFKLKQKTVTGSLVEQVRT